MARGENKPYEATEVWRLLDELRTAAAFESEGQFATAAGFLPSSFSDWKTGKHVLSTLSLVRLIRAASARRATALYEAGEAVSPEAALLHRLAAVEEKVEGLGGTLDDLVAYVREHLPPAASQEQVNGG